MKRNKTKRVVYNVCALHTMKPIYMSSEKNLPPYLFNVIFIRFFYTT